MRAASRNSAVPKEYRSASRGVSAVPAIVLGNGLTALGVQRALAAAGIEPLLVEDRRSFARRSRWSRGRSISRPEITDPSELGSFLDSLPVERGVLLPCSDNWTLTLSNLAALTDGRFVTSMPPRTAVDLLADKAGLADALTRLEVAHPWTKVINDPGDLDEIPDEKWSNIFLKPTDSQSFSQRFGVKAFSVNDRADARRRFGLMEEAGIGAVAQEYVPGPPDRHYFIDGFVDRDGTLQAALSRRRTRMFPPDYGNSCFMETVPLATVGNAATELERLLQHLSYRGIYSAEFKHDPRDGVFRLLEVNVRPYWYLEFTSLCGVNLAEMTYLDALELPVPDRREFVVGKRHMLMPEDAHAFLHYRKTSGLTLRSWLSQIWGANDAIFRWADPMPAFEPVFIFPRRVVNKLKKIARRARERRRRPDTG